MHFTMEEFGKVCLIILAICLVLGIMYVLGPIVQNGVSGMIEKFVNSVDIPTL